MPATWNPCGNRSASSALQPWTQGSTPEEQAVSFTHGHPRFRMLLRPSNYDEESWSHLIGERAHAYHVAALRMVARRAVATDEDCVAIDVGAGSGYMSLTAASLGCNVFSFEPNPVTARLAR
eukprot:3426515-Prymnesium_polylepis.1